MAYIGEMHYLTIGSNTYSIPTSGGSTVAITRSLTSGTKSATITVDGTDYDIYSKSGTVTSVQVQASSPLQSSTSTSQSTSLNTTISFANQNANKVLAGPSTGSAAAPTFRSLVAADIPDLSGTYLTSFTETDPTVPSWAKASSKPSYNFSEIGNTPTTISGYGITDAKIASGTITLGSNTITPLTSDSTLNAAKLSGAIPSAVTATTQASTDNSTKIATTAYVTTAIANLPEPMLFKGSVGTGGTITSLPTAAAANEGYTYKVITALSTPVTAKVGDTVISTGSEWVVIPSGDEPSGTVTSITLKAGSGIALDTDDTAITTSGTRTISHSDTSSQASVSNSGRTYIQSITLDTYGHVTGLSSATESVTNTDIKLQIAEITSGTQYYPLVGTGTTAATRQYDTTGLKYKGTNGTTSAVGSSILELGNNIASGTANNKQAQLIMYGSNAKKATITLAAPSADIALALPTSGGTLALTSQIPTVPSTTGSATTGISIADHSTTTVTGVSGSTTVRGVKTGTNSLATASKASGGNGSASTWTFESKSIPNVTAAGSASTWTFESKTVMTDLTMTINDTDSGQLDIAKSTTTVYSKSGGANGSAPTLGTAITVYSKSGGANGTAPTWSFTDVDVPIRNDSDTTVPTAASSATTVVTSKTHSITDNGHTHSI